LGEAAGRLLIIGDAQYPDYKMTIRPADSCLFKKTVHFWLSLPAEIRILTERCPLQPYLNSTKLRTEPFLRNPAQLPGRRDEGPALQYK